jgi:hypothetical protein
VVGDQRRQADAEVDDGAVGMSRATRAAIWSRVQRVTHGVPMSSCGSCRALEAAGPAWRARSILHDALHEEARRDDGFGVERAEFHDLVHLATVVFAAIAMTGPKLRAVMR